MGERECLRYDELFHVDEARTRALAPSPDFTIEWRALWDNTNLYVMAKVNDDAIVNSLPAFGGPDSDNVGR